MINPHKQLLRAGIEYQPFRSEFAIDSTVRASGFSPWPMYQFVQLQMFSLMGNVYALMTSMGPEEGEDLKILEIKRKYDPSEIAKRGIHMVDHVRELHRFMQWEDELCRRLPEDYQDPEVQYKLERAATWNRVVYQTAIHGGISDEQRASLDRSLHADYASLIANHSPEQRRSMLDDLLAGRESITPPNPQALTEARALEILKAVGDSHDDLTHQTLTNLPGLQEPEPEQDPELPGLQEPEPEQDPELPRDFTLPREDLVNGRNIFEGHSNGDIPQEI